MQPPPGICDIFDADEHHTAQTVIKIASSSRLRTPPLNPGCTHPPAGSRTYRYSHHLSGNPVDRSRWTYNVSNYDSERVERDRSVFALRRPHRTALAVEGTSREACVSGTSRPCACCFRRNRRLAGSGDLSGAQKRPLYPRDRHAQPGITRPGSAVKGDASSHHRSAKENLGADSAQEKLRRVHAPRQALRRLVSGHALGRAVRGPEFQAA